VAAPFLLGVIANMGGLFRHVGLWLGLALCGTILLFPVPGGMTPAAMSVAAVAVLMAVWWITEAIPIPATAMLPIVLFPILEVMSTSQVTSSYANHLIYLFMGGFMLAMAIEKWNLHKRIALHTVLLVGSAPDRIVLGFMLATAFLSAWISNTATAMLMVTIAMSVLSQVADSNNKLDNNGVVIPSNFGASLMLGIAYAASIGGVATLIGTPPNAILAGVVEKEYGYSIGFVEWMQFAAPLSLMMLAIAWWYLTRFAFRNDMQALPGGRAVVMQQLDELGAMSRQEWRVLIVFSLVVAAWLLRGLSDWDIWGEVKDSNIAIAGALLLFVLPSGRGGSEKLLDWGSAVRIPWDIIILFGGGFALASGFSSSGLTQWIGEQFVLLHGVSLIGLVLVVVCVVIFLTEVTSNTATASLLLPVMAGVALAAEAPAMVLMGSVALAASFAFMLPVATPPNAIVFSSHQVSIAQMARVGVWMNAVGIVVITAFITQWLPWVLVLPALG